MMDFVFSIFALLIVGVHFAFYIRQLERNRVDRWARNVGIQRIRGESNRELIRRIAAGLRITGGRR